MRASTEPNRVWQWITGGNTLARVGIIVLFVGVGFLLKYAAEHVTVPIELRVAGVALGGIVLLVLGWRLRDRREGYAMILQGGGVESSSVNRRPRSGFARSTRNSDAVRRPIGTRAGSVFPREAVIVFATMEYPPSDSIVDGWSRHARYAPWASSAAFSHRF